VRAALVLAALCACRADRPVQEPAPVPVVIENTARGCGEAAAGLERATRGLRPPEESILAPMRALCIEDAWPTVAIDCFAAMTPDDLGKCAGLVATKPREALFARIAGLEHDQAALAILVARLANVKVGIAECDGFVTAVSRAMSCEGLSLEQRHGLGSETVDFWSLNTSRLPPDAVAKMVRACGESLSALQTQVAAVGCM
jgi:hypothetical protein